MSTLISDHYLRNRSTLGIGVLGYIGIVQHMEHSPEVLSHSSWDTLYNTISILVRQIAEWQVNGELRM